MSETDPELVEKFYRFMTESLDEAAVAELYAPDALIIRFDSTSAGFKEILTFLTGVRSRHKPYKLYSIDQVTKVGNVVMWDAVIDTAEGMLETTEVLVLDDDGKIERHIPGVRGYWGS